MWWFIPVISALKRPKKEGFYEFKPRLCEDFQDSLSQKSNEWINEWQNRIILLNECSEFFLLSFYSKVCATKLSFWYSLKYPIKIFILCLVGWVNFITDTDFYKHNVLSP